MTQVSDERLAEMLAEAKAWIKCDETWRAEQIAILTELQSLRSQPEPAGVRVKGKAERHQDTERNKLVNTASTDLEAIISGHDPEVHHLGNRVWDRLDQLAADIERRALSALDLSPVDENPSWFAVQSVTGTHIGMWQDERIARRVFDQEYPDGRFIPLYAVLPSPVAPPEGYALVPIEPTAAMLKKAFAAMNDTPSGKWKQMKAENKTPREIFDAKMVPRWKAMVDALPVKPQSGEEE